MTIREFYNLKQRSEYIREITSAFHKQIAPIYGDQMEACLLYTSPSPRD